MRSDVSNKNLIANASRCDLTKLRAEERIAAELSCLYTDRGYKEYKMSAFEEYSTYMDNMDFLISRNIITFSGADGRLMALRPDVTLSVLKNAKVAEGKSEKLFYNEKVYRQERGSKTFKEVSQIGVEVIGDVDKTTEAEIAVLILKTLARVSENYVLDLSHMGFVNGLLSDFCLNAEQKSAFFEYLKGKNVHDFMKYAEEIGLEKEKAERFKAVAELDGSPDEALERAEMLCVNAEMESAVRELKSLVFVLKKLGYADRVNIDFSVANAADYYNGITFGGYVEGVPKAVLSGGRYDLLAEKFGKKAGAIGFALYLGEACAYLKENIDKTDILLICDEENVAEALLRAEELNAAGKSVKLVKSAEGEEYKEAEYIK